MPPQQQPSTNHDVRDIADNNSVDMLSVDNNDNIEHADNADDDDEGNGTIAQELVQKKYRNRPKPYHYGAKSAKRVNAASKRDAQITKQLEHEIHALRRSQRLINMNREQQQPPAQFDDGIFYPLPPDSDAPSDSDAGDNNGNDKSNRSKRPILQLRTREEIKKQQREPKYRLVSRVRTERKRKACTKSRFGRAFGEPRSKIAKKNIEKKVTGAEKPAYKLISSNRLERKRKPNAKNRPCGEPEKKKPYIPRALRSSSRLSNKNATGQGLDFTTKQFHKHVGTCTNTLTYWDDPNELVDRLRLLASSASAGHTGHNNEIISIIEELREANLIE